MSMGNIESYYQVVPDAVVKKVVGAKVYDAYTKAINALTASGMDDYEINDNLEDGLDKEHSPEWEAYLDAYETLTNTFKVKTNMALYAEYTSGDGDCYDDLEVNEWYWCIPEAAVWKREMTTAAEAFMKQYSTKKQVAIERDCRFSRYG